VIAAERFDAPAAIAAFHKSMALRPSATAARNLALTAGSVAEAWGNYTLAWTTLTAWVGPADPGKPNLEAALSREIATFGVSNPGYLAPFEAWLNAQDDTAAWQRSDAVRYARVVLAMGSGKAADAKELISGNCWPTYMQSHGQALATQWFLAEYALEEASLGRTLTPWEKHELRRRRPVPKNIGYSCEGLSC
jgi:hypothetical protein